MHSSPWAKLRIPVDLKINTNPRAINAYIAPVDNPLKMISINFSIFFLFPDNATTRNLDFPVSHIQAENPASSIQYLTSSRALPRSIHHFNFLLKTFADYLAFYFLGGSELFIILVQFLFKNFKFLDGLDPGQGFIGIFNFVFDQFMDIGILSKTFVVRVGDFIFLGPVADVFKFNLNQGSKILLPIADNDGLFDIGAALQIVFDFRRVKCFSHPM